MGRKKNAEGPTFGDLEGLAMDIGLLFGLVENLIQAVIISFDGGPVVRAATLDQMKADLETVKKRIQLATGVVSDA